MRAVFFLAAGLFLWSGGPAAAAPSCTAWNTKGFFQVARAADVYHCLKTQKVNAGDGDGNTPLHKAAKSRSGTTP